MAKRKYWLGKVPTFCDTCDNLIDKVFYDAKTIHGPWACMCKTCFTNGPGLGKLGSGLGQEYTEEQGTWYKTS